MTNPFQYGGPGFLPDTTSSSSTAGQRRSSYASVVSGSRPQRSGAVSHLLNPSPDADFSSNLYSARSYNTVGRNGADETAPSADHSWPPTRTGNAGSGLPSFSRAYEMFMSKEPLSLGLGGSEEYGGSHSLPQTNISSSGFLAPSYLRGSVYLQRLEEAHRRRLLAQQRDAQAHHHHGHHYLGHHGAAHHHTGSGGLKSSASSLSLHSNGALKTTSMPPPTSYRGMTFDVVEKAPQMDADAERSSEQMRERYAQLPSRWNTDDRHPALEVLGDGYEVRHPGSRGAAGGSAGGERDHEACAIRADNAIPAQCGVYYFEILLLNRKRDDTTIVIGFSTKDVPLARAPGWEPESWGYHGDDGHSFAAQNTGKPYGPKFGPGDTVGCLINFRTGTAMFTKNGDEIGIAFRDVKGKLFPTIGLKKPGDHIWVNFGQLPFQYDIDGYMKKEKQTILDKIENADTSKLAPPLNETELIQQLVLQFLQHDGYVETARAFAEEIHAEKVALSLDPNVEIEGINIKDDEDANKRQQIRRSILEGKIDQALKCTNAYYPQVLKENEQVYFRLRCRKFIEMIRKDAEENLRLEGNPNMERKGFTTTSNHRNGNEDDDVMVDDDFDDDQMDDTADEGTQPVVGKLLEEALTYGQELRAEFDGDPRREITKQLDEIFALIAYPNPLKVKEVAHLLDRTGRVAVAEELNSAILLSLGKSSRAALETLYAQTNVLLDELRQDGGEGAFVTVQAIIDDIPTSRLLP